MEAGTFRFRDPLNKDRRFIPLRLDDALIKGSLAQFLYINWFPANREQEYAKLLEARRSRTLGSNQRDSVLPPSHSEVNHSSVRHFTDTDAIVQEIMFYA